MMKTVTRKTISLALTLAALLFSAGCATETPIPHQEFSPTYRPLASLPQRSQPAKCTGDDELALMRQGYYKLGDLWVWIEGSSDPGEGRKLLLSGAAERGGDVVRITQEPKSFTREEFRQGFNVDAARESTAREVAKHTHYFANEKLKSEDDAAVSALEMGEQGAEALNTRFNHSVTGAGEVWRSEPVRQDWMKGWEEATLVSAAGRGQVNIVEYLLGKGLNANTKDNTGSTPLHSAAYLGQKDMAELLLVKGAEVNAKDNHGLTPLDRAAMHGHKEVVEVLLAKGANIKTKDNNGYTPLHRAASTGQKDVVELLLAKGVDVNTKDNDGSTALHKAAYLDRRDVVELLLAKGADINAKDNEGHTPLQVAKPRIATLLRAHGARD